MSAGGFLPVRLDELNFSARKNDAIHAHPKIGMSSCVVCFEDFNKSTRSKTTCPYCTTSICRGCLQQYVLNDITDEPKCVNTTCESRWTRDFLDTQLTATFRFNQYKKHREQILYDREKSRLPATQEDAAAYKVAVSKYITMPQVNGDYLLYRDKLIQNNTTYTEQRALRNTVQSFGRVRINGDAAPIVHRVAFIRPCPAEDCRGFLSTAWKCGMCNKYTCKDCHELKGARQDAAHTCHPDNIASAAAIIAETKPCPKCGIRIWKIQGCDQMWCTGCNTGFSWTTGQIVTGPIHNPHYFEWMRRNNQAPLPAAPVFNCDVANEDQIHMILDTHNPRSTKAWLLEAWRILREEQDHRPSRITEEEAHRILRVRYLVEEITEDEWKQKMQQAEKKYRYIRAVQQVRETIVGGGQDILRQVLQPVHDTNKIKEQVKDLLAFCNKSYETIGKQFNCKVESYMINVDARHEVNIKLFEERRANDVKSIHASVKSATDMLDTLITEMNSSTNDITIVTKYKYSIIRSIEDTMRRIQGYLREETAIATEIAAERAPTAAT